jgi:hypothetical protein
VIVYIIVSLISGILFGFLDGLINANPFAQKLYEVFKPISKQTINVPAGFVIDLVFGFAMAGIFLILYDGLPGDIGVVKGISFALVAWFFRVVMSVASQWMMFVVPVKTLFYAPIVGLVEMLALGLIYGMALKP